MTFKESDRASRKDVERWLCLIRSPIGHVGNWVRANQSRLTKDVIGLINLMNSIPSIETKGSSQGQDPNYGYVQFMPDDTEGKAHASICFIYHILNNMHAAWGNHTHVMWEYEQSTGSEHPDVYRFKFTTELGNGYVLKWSP